MNQSFGRAKWETNRLPPQPNRAGSLPRPAAFVTRFTAAGSAIALDASERAYIVGVAESPVSPSRAWDDGHRRTHRSGGIGVLHGGFGGGEGVAFLGVVNGRGATHTGVSRLGVSEADRSRAITVSSIEEARVVGEPNSNDCLSVAAWQDHLAGAAQFGGDAWATVLTGPTRPPAPTEPDREYAHAVYAANSAGRSETFEALQALISPKARLTGFSKRIDFGKAPLGASRRRTLRLRNSGRGPSRVWQSVPRPPYAWVGPTSLIIPPHREEAAGTGGALGRRELHER